MPLSKNHPKKFNSMKNAIKNNLSPDSILNSDFETNEDEKEIIDSDEEIFQKINNY